MSADQYVGWVLTIASIAVLLVGIVRVGRATTRIEAAAGVATAAAATAQHAANKAFYDKQGVTR